MNAQRYVSALAALCAAAAVTGPSVCSGQTYCYSYAAPIVYPVTAYQPAYVAYSPIVTAPSSYYASSTSYYYPTAQQRTTNYPTTAQPRPQPAPKRAYAPGDAGGSENYTVFQRSGQIFAADNSGALWRFEESLSGNVLGRWKKVGAPVDPFRN